MKPFFYKLLRNVAEIFKGTNLFWHLLAIVSTLVIVRSGTDWFIFEHTRSPIIFLICIPAALLGFIVPVFTPIYLLFKGWHKKDQRILNAAYALTQAAALGWLVSSTYKAFTGRAHPIISNGGTALLDISREFHFGLLQGGIFWGWPSSHTAVAFAMAATAVTLHPNKRVQLLALLLATYIGLSVSVTIHWFSDFVAGAIIGTVVGLVVGRAYRSRPF